MRWLLVLLLALTLPSQAEVRRFRLQIEVQHQGNAQVIQRSYWVREYEPRPLELEFLPEGAELTASATMDVHSGEVTVYFQVVAPPELGYQELSPPRLVLKPDSAPMAFCFALKREVYRINLTSLKVQVLD